MAMGKPVDQGFKQMVIAKIEEKGFRVKDVKDHFMMDCPQCNAKLDAFCYPHHANSRIQCNRKSKCGFSSTLHDLIGIQDDSPFQQLSNDHEITINAFKKHGLDISFFIEKNILNSKHPLMSLGEKIIDNKLKRWYKILVLNKEKQKPQWIISGGFSNSLAEYYPVLNDQKKDTLYIFEGEWDWFKGMQDGLACTSSLFGCDYLPSLTKTLKMFMEYDQIIIALDNDAPGKKAARSLKFHLQKKFPQKPIGVINWPEKEGCNDYCDYRQHYDLDWFIKLGHDAAVIKEVNISRDSKFIVRNNGIYYKGREKGEDGEYRQISKQICKDSVIVESRLQDIHDMKGLVELKWSCFRTVVGMEAFWFKNIDTLTQKGIRIFTSNGKIMSKYFEACLEQTEDVKPYTSKNGWYMDDFIIGRCKILGLDLSEETIARPDDSIPIASRGDYNSWLTIVHKYSEDPQYQVIFSLAVGSIMVELLAIDSFTVHLWGTSSGGKSFVQKIAASFYGDHRKLCIPWKATQVGHEAYLAQMCNLMAIFDDSQQNKTSVVDILYMIGNNKNKPRSNKKIGLNEQKEWRLAACSSGEKKVTTETQQGGVSGRVIEILREPIKEYTVSEIRADTKTITDNHGHAGKIIIKYIMKNKDELQDRFSKLLEDLQNYLKSNDVTQSNIQSRLIPFWALIFLGCQINKELFNIQYDKTKVVNQLKRSFSEMENKTPGENFYSALIQLYANNVKLFHVRNKNQGWTISEERNTWGFFCEKENVIYFSPDNLRQQLDRVNHDWSGISQLKEKGLLKTPTCNKTGKQVGLLYRARIQGQPRQSFVALKVKNEDLESNTNFGDLPSGDTIDNAINNLN